MTTVISNVGFCYVGSLNGHLDFGFLYGKVRTVSSQAGLRSTDPHTAETKTRVKGVVRRLLLLRILKMVQYHLHSLRVVGPEVRIKTTTKGPDRRMGF